MRSSLYWHNSLSDFYHNHLFPPPSIKSYVFLNSSSESMWQKADIKHQIDFWKKKNLEILEVLIVSSVVIYVWNFVENFSSMYNHCELLVRKRKSLSS